MTFYAEMNGKQIKKFAAQSMITIYSQYNKYCKRKLNNANLVSGNPTSFGFCHWTDGENVIKLVKEQPVQ